MLTSALLIHLSGGRIETHFHIFGSLAFLACYRDWRVLLTATVVVVADHWLRGLLWPESIYGVLNGTSLRFIEHAGWVILEDVILIATIRQSVAEMKRTARQRAQLESTNRRIEREVHRRTEDLRKSIEATANANAQLAEANRVLQQKNEELDQFTYIASHDLQEPVRNLISYSKLLEQDLQGDLSDDAQQDLDFIVDASRRMQNLIQALLELSRIGRSSVKQDRVDLNECVQLATNSLQMRIAESGAIITQDPLPVVLGDRIVLTQLLQNLLSNALKFSGDARPEISIRVTRERDHWIIAIQDNGIGMQLRYADKIFHPFQRLHSRKDFPGTGIGLSICRKAVQRHGGKIWVESQPGEGSRFLFTLPASALAANASDSAETAIQTVSASFDKSSNVASLGLPTEAAPGSPVSDPH